MNIFSVTKNPFDLINENPESKKAGLVNIYDGVVMNDKDADFFLHAKEIGMKEAKLFIENDFSLTIVTIFGTNKVN